MTPKEKHIRMYAKHLALTARRRGRAGGKTERFAVQFPVLMAKPEA
jgi:hypothetical protein